MESNSKSMFDAARPKLSALMRDRGIQQWQIDIVQLSIKHFEYDESKGPIIETALFPAQVIGPRTTDYGTKHDQCVCMRLYVTNAVMSQQMTPEQAMSLRDKEFFKCLDVDRWQPIWTKMSDYFYGESAEKIIKDDEESLVHVFEWNIGVLVGIGQCSMLEVTNEQQQHRKKRKV